MRRLSALLVVALGATTFAASGAGADTGGNAITDHGGIAHETWMDLGAVGSDGRDDTNPDWPCWWYPLDYPADATVILDDGTPLTGDGTGAFYSYWCGGDDGWGDIVYVHPVDPLAMAARASRYLPLPDPRPRFSPAGDQVVNLASWLWLDPSGWAPEQSTVAVPGVSVTVTAQPEQVIWQPGDGSTVVCTGPGTPFDLAQPAQVPTCSHIYTRSSASQPDGVYRASVTIVWSASWVAVGTPGGGDLGTVERTTALDVRVGEVQAINTAADR
jgi:hypothetical protein